MSEAPARNLELQSEILGTLIQKPCMFDEVAARIDAGNHLALEEDRQIFSTIGRLKANGDAVDFVLLANEFPDEPRVRWRLAAIGAGVPDSARLFRYCDEVRALAVKRQLSAVGNDIEKALRDGEDVYGVASRFADRLAGFATNKETAASRIDQVVIAAAQEADRRRATGDHLPGIRTANFPKLDSVLQGLARKTLALIGGYTSSGKTALLLALVVDILKRNPNLRAAMYSLEMSAEMLGRRLLAAESKVALWKIRTGSLSDDEADAVATAARSLAAIRDRLILNDASNTIAQVTTECRALATRQPLDIIVVDYVQLLGGRGGNNRELEVSAIGRDLLGLAKRFDAVVLAAAQLNEGAALKASPTLSDMRESRALNQHARTVMLLHRPYAVHRDDSELKPRPCDTQLIVAKNSEGELGAVQLHFSGETQTFTEEGCTPRCRHYVRAEVTHD